MGDGTRVLVRGDLLVLWRDGVQASMTGKQWLATTDEIERHRIEAEKFDTAVASRDLEIEHLQRHIRDRGIPSAFEQSSPQAYVDGLAPKTCDDLRGAAEFASGVLAELYAKYQTKIGPFASQAQVANGWLRAALKAKVCGGCGHDIIPAINAVGYQCPCGHYTALSEDV